MLYSLGVFKVRIGKCGAWLSFLIFLLIACSSDTITDPTLPATLRIIPLPDHAQFSWTLSDKQGFAQEGTGEAEVENLAPGEYTVSWEYRLGWDAPPRRTFFLESAESKQLVEKYEPPQGFVEIAPGSFLMGTPEDEPFFWPHEYPQHRVTISPWLHVQSTEVTNSQYMHLAEWAWTRGYCQATRFRLSDSMGDGSTLLDLGDSDCEIAFDGEEFSCVNPDHPVKELTWFGAVSYCNWMSLYLRLPLAYDPVTWECNEGSPHSSQGFRLPTEAEWEYACRAGTSSAYCCGPINDDNCCDEPALVDYGWFCEEEGSFIVAQKLPNAWQLYDMHGNVSEWCNDWYSEGYPSEDQTDPLGASTGEKRIQRGGDWGNCAFGCRSANRGPQHPDTATKKVGFRVLRTAY